MSLPAAVPAAAAPGRALAPLVAALSLAALAAVAATGCNSAGPRAIRDARFPYNEALVQTSNEQLLLNLVRLRYRDTPYFLEATGLTTQYELSGSAAAGVTLVEGGDGDASLGTGIAVAETPTVTYVPLQGEDFVKQLLRRVPLDDVMLLPQSGWSIERVMRLAVHEIAGLRNAPTTTGPTPDTEPDFQAFNCLAATLRALQRENRLSLRVEPVPSPPEKSGAEEEGGAAAEDEFTYTLQIGGDSLPEWPAACTQEAKVVVAKVLRPGTTWAIRHPWNLDRKAGTDPGDGGVAVTTRSLMGALHYLSQAVEVPAEHLRAGLATPTGPSARGCTAPAPPNPAPSGADPAARAPTPTTGQSQGRRTGQGPAADWTEELYRDFFRVHCSPHRPEGAFVSIRYRGHWYYIADHDLQTKSTWGLLAQLVSLQAGADAHGLVPTLTLSAGR